MLTTIAQECHTHFDLVHVENTSNVIAQKTNTDYQLNQKPKIDIKPEVLYLKKKRV